MAKKTEKAKTTKKKTLKKESPRDKLEKELKGYLKKIDEEGLIFLLKQAQVIIHNAEVDKINKEIVAFEQKKKAHAAKNPPSSKKSKTLPTGSVAIEEISNGKSFFITLKNARKIFDLQEMRSLVKICHGAENASQAGGRLYTWFHRNRTDVLADCGLSGKGDSFLALLYKTIIKTYKVSK
ncbi:MAG: hypothetical protein JXJ04_12830 [Spirochaetales bacterium]|nr:hypothetical protein [Spirochaetales bacterium]